MRWFGPRLTTEFDSSTCECIKCLFKVLDAPGPAVAASSAVVA